MATEALVWPGPPSLTNGYDAQDYTLGVRFSLVAPQDCSGIVWERTPDVVSHTPAGGQWIATLWNWDTQAIIASVAFTPLAAVRQEISFGSVFPLVNGVNYAATVFTQDYTFLAGGGGDIFTPSLNVSADVGVIGVSSDPVAFPAGQPSSWFFVGPRMEIDGPDPAEGTVALGLDLALSTTGGAGAEGAAALGIGLAVAVSGSAPVGGTAALGFNLAVAASGSAPNQGVVALTLGLNPDASGERASQGVASLGLGLAVAASGERNSLGSVALGLNLAVSATGSNGDVGCPIEPFPFTSSPLDGYPWAAQPVKSFTGGECS